MGGGRVRAVKTEMSLVSLTKLTIDLCPGLAMEPITRQCPYLGRYDVVFVTRPPGADHGDSWSPRVGNERSRITYGENVAEVRAAKLPTTPAPVRCHQASVDGLNIGCTEPDLMEFATDCTDKALFSEFVFQ
jgi:hypothetical protein